MAKQTGLFKFTGKLDNVIGYRRNGTHFFRSMPDKVRQTAATRQASRNFGISSRKGKLIRRAITPYLGRYDGTTVNRLNKALIQSGDLQLQAIEGFRFNRHTGLDKFFALPAVFTDGLLKIPAQELPFMGRATHLEVSLIAATINFAERRITAVEAVTEIIDLNTEFNGLELTVPLGGKGTLIVTLQVQACTTCNGKIVVIQDRRYTAADIVSVVPGMKVSSRKNGKKKRVGPLPHYYQGRWRAQVLSGSLPEAQGTGGDTHPSWRGAGASTGDTRPSWRGAAGTSAGNTRPSWRGAAGTSAGGDEAISCRSAARLML